MAKKIGIFCTYRFKFTIYVLIEEVLVRFVERSPLLYFWVVLEYIIVVEFSFFY